MEEPTNKIAWIVRIFKDDAFVFVSFFVSFLLFSWPYVSFLENASVGTMLIYFFIVFALLILALLISAVVNKKQ